jgi:ABC-2 type transport system ATP-binding protein
MNIAFTVKNLSKDYDKVHALRDVSLTIPAGQITGLVGPNGAGKTTLIKSLVGALQPTNGSMSVLGLDPIQERWQLRKKLGYMPQEPALYDDLSARENVAFYARLHHIDSPRDHAEKILTELELGKRLHSPVHTLSGGMQKRVSLACALVHDPQLLILDEPTAALDPLLKRYMWKRFQALADQGKTLIVTTHLMDEAMLCDSVVLLREGRVIAHDAPRKLIAAGKTVLRFFGRGKQWDETVQADGTAIVQALRKHGLSSNINRLDIDVENLEDVMVTKLKEEEKK